MLLSASLYPATLGQLIIGSPRRGISGLPETFYKGFFLLISSRVFACLRGLQKLPVDLDKPIDI
jgi:hypothetical protein